MTNSRWFGLSASVPVYLFILAGCSASVDSSSPAAQEAQPDAAARSVAAAVAPSEDLSLPIPIHKICLPASCNSACAAQTGFPGNNGGVCEGTTCVCSSNAELPATVSAGLFNDLVAYQLSGIVVEAAGNQLTVTLPSQLGGGSSTTPINASNANVSYLKIPSQARTASGAWGWQWSMSPSSNLITITSALDATITGSWSGVSLGPLGSVGGCGVTAVITNAPVTITLQNNVNYTLTGPENYLTVQSVSIPLSGSNTEANGCSLVPADDIRGQFQSQLQSNIQSQLNGMPVMSTMLDSIVQTMANDDPDPLTLPSLPGGMRWSCGTWQQAALVTGAITGVCHEACN